MVRLFMIVGLLVLFISTAYAAQRVVVCDELYQEG
jgi:hypothetical protein